MKIRFIEPGNRPYKKTIQNWFVYDRYIRTPSNGILTLATILKQEYEDVFCYSESISEIVWEDVLDADIVCISIFTFNANRGYELAEYIRVNSNAVIVFGGLHATLNWQETIQYAGYVLLGEGDETILPLINNITDCKTPDFPGVIYQHNGKTICSGDPVIPTNIDTIPDRTLMYNFKKMTSHTTIWPQVHASRSCPHNCDYCALVAAFGRCFRGRTPEVVVEDIRQAIAFFDKGHHRLAKMLWITDDNFFSDRKWAISVLDAIIASDINYKFTIQARYEVGFDDELLEKLKNAGFVELALGIEFLEDEAFQNYNKKSTYEEILNSVKNIQRHGLRIRGLFIIGADNHEKGIGEKLTDYVIDNNISGCLIQSMYFIPGTPAYESHKDELIQPCNWSRCTGKVVHHPKLISAIDLQKEIMIATRKIYSPKRLLNAIFRKRGLDRILFIGECIWHHSVRKDLKKDLENLM